MNVGYLLANSAAKFGRQEAVVCDQGRWSFAQFEERTARLAGAMRAAGLVRGEKVALLFFNGGPFVETYFAAIRVGLVAVPVNFRLVGAEMAYILQDSGAAALFHGPEFLPVIAEIRDQCPALRFVVCPGGERPRALDYEEFLSQGTPCGVDATVTESDQCQLMYTSGTTGKPKGVQRDTGGYAVALAA